MRVPRGRGETVAVRYAGLPASERVTFAEHLVKRGETLSEIARSYRVSVPLITGSILIFGCGARTSVRSSMTRATSCPSS